MPKHTSEPWHILPFGKDNPTNFSGVTIYGQDSLRVAEVYFTRNRPEHEHQSNARLICAAPQLLTGLENLLTELRRSRHKMNVRKDFSLMNAEACASKAIHKLNGEGSH